MDKENIINYRDTINALNTDFIEIHCKLTGEINNLQELLSIQGDLDVLSSKYYIFNQGFQENYKIATGELVELRKNFSNKTRFYAVFALIPILGIFIAIYLALRDYNRLLETKLKVGDLDKFAEEFRASTKILGENIERKYNLLNRKLLAFTGTHTKEEEQSNYDNYTYYNASEMIINFLDDFSLNIEDVEPSVQEAMIRLLQQDLKTECSDLLVLLNQAKENKAKDLKLVRKNNL